VADTWQVAAEAIVPLNSEGGLPAGFATCTRVRASWGFT